MMQIFSNIALKKGLVFFTMVFGLLFEVPESYLSSTIENQDMKKEERHLIETKQIKTTKQTQESSAVKSAETISQNAASKGLPQKAAPAVTQKAMSQEEIKKLWMNLNKKTPVLHDLNQLDRFESMEVIATGYYAGVESTGKDKNHPQYGITYSGVKVRRDVFSTIAADLKVFPLGTILYIPGYGYGIVADIGSKVKGNKIDLYFETKEQVFKEWGKRKVNVYVVKKGNGKVSEALFDNLNGLFSGKAKKEDSQTDTAGFGLVWET